MTSKKRTKSPRSSRGRKSATVTTAPGVTSAAPEKITREKLLGDLKRVASEHPETRLTRDLYRTNGTYSEGIWTGFFSSFATFRDAAGLTTTPSDAKAAGQEFDDSILHKSNYAYNPETETYITFLPRAKRVLTFSTERHQAMLQAYSDWDGAPQTINQLCRSFGIKRGWFHEYKAIHGWTHDSDPFTTEEVMSRPIEDMAEDAVQMRRLALYRTFEAKKWDATKRNSDNWLDLEQSVLTPLMNHIQKNASKFRAPMLNLKPRKEKFSVVIPAYDLHYGKGAWRDETGEGYSREEAAKLLTYHTNDLAKFVSSFGRPERIFCPTASDFIHVDNPQHKSTKGTPQDTDGTRAQILIEGCELAVQHALQLGQIAPLDWIPVPGNHDEDTALSVMMYMRAWFRNDKHVTIDYGAKLRRYKTYGNSFMGFFHGHGLKLADMHAVMSKEGKELWRKCEWYYAFSGHLHHEVVREIAGMKHFQTSSLAGHDRWHAANGYVTSARAMQAYVVSEARGVIAEFISPVVHQDYTAGVKVRRSVA